MNSQQIVAEKLLQINAIQLNVQAPFSWASGWKSPIYCDNRRILSYPYVRDYIKSELSNLVYETFPEAAVIGGVATAGIPHGVLVADQLKLPFIYVRSKSKGHGLGNQIEGRIEPGQKVVVIEDLISTGKSSLAACQAIQEAGMEVIGAVAIFTYGFDKASQVFEEAAIPLKTLSDYPTLIALAAEKGKIDGSALAVLEEWRKDPASWMQ